MDPMVPNCGNRFPKEHRLRKRWQFLDVQGNGKKVTSRFFIGLVSIQQPECHPKLGITATGRFGNAVARNRIKRLVRESFRKHVMAIPDGVAIVVIPKKHAINEDSQSLYKDLATLGKRVTGYVENRMC